jgi:hypothetical protein
MITRQLLASLLASLILLAAADTGGVRRGNQGDSRRRLNFFSDLANILFGRWMEKHDVSPIDDIKNGWDIPLSDDVKAAAEYREEDAASVPEPILFEPLTLKDTGKMANIVGGSDASPQEAPWFVMILTFNSAVPQWEFSGCSGVLLSNLHVLTAGHCAKGRDPANDGVFVHAYQPYWGNPNLRFHFSKVESYTMHPDFDDGPNKSDTAIITMKNPLDLEDFETVDLARPSTPVQDGDTVNVYGFGRLSDAGDSSVQTLQRVSMPYISGTSCQEYYPDGDVLEDMFCAGDEDGGRDACSGDSGGPLIKQVDGTSVILGLVSWGDGCGEADKPGVYTSVQYHFDWIQNTVCDDPNVDDSTRLCSSEPSLSLTTASSTVPSSKPSAAPSSAPSRMPSSPPSSKPSATPSSVPSSFLSTPTPVPTSISTSTLQPSTTSPTRALTLTPTSTSSSFPSSGAVSRSSSEGSVIDGVADNSSSGDSKGRSGYKRKRGSN